MLQAQQAEADDAAEQAVANGALPTIAETPGLANGDGSHISPYTESALPIPPMSQEASQLSSAPHLPSAPADDPATSAPATMTTTEKVDAPKKQTWQAHNLDIDIVSLKLSKHKYLTPSDFLADIAKIEENADKLGDPDRIARIGEMGAHARMHVMNFDPAWEPRFEAYAQRVRDRKAKRQKEKEEAKRAELGGNGGEILAVPASAAGEVAQEADGAQGESMISSSLKRPREGEGSAEAERGDKRPREDDVVMDGSSVPAPPPPATAQEPSQSAITIGTVPTDEAATVPAPRVVHPPFHVPAEELEHLSTNLVLGTATFTVEQLEQLRAMCFDKIWRHRADWDRRECVRNVRTALDDFIVEVEDVNAFNAEQVFSA